MVKKRNSFIVTDIVDYQNKKKTDVKKEKKSFEKKSKKLKIKSKSPNDFKPKSEIKANEEKSEAIPTKNGNHNHKDKNPRFKTNRFRTKCFENRRERGMLLLSTKVENKIYKLKKSLQKKGLPELEIRDIINERRRKEENEYNKIMSKNCFKCRKPGHILADCPYNKDSEEGVDICYRCGSSEHNLSDCRQRGEDLPFAKCFICRQTGHLTRDCTENKRGVYPKGGECKACHSVNHLIKDCPLNIKDEEMEREITLPTFNTNHSIDAEIVDDIQNQVIKDEEQQKKVIKF